MAQRYEDIPTSVILRAQVGEPAAVSELVLLLSERAFSLAYRMCGDPEEAKDICQEMLMHVVKNAARYDPARPFLPWFYRVASNVCLNWLVSPQHRARAKSLDQGSSQHPGFQPASMARGPATDAMARDMRDVVHQIVHLLPEEYRAVIVLHYFEGVPYPDLGEILGLPLGTVKVRLFRGRELLREKLEALGFDKP
ncbi:MAG: sigma-70 family RNA polymerase sigma factor [Planctomycetota bacterium]|nr:sigma-70 family RNA polymerase sigma factor [Planctomycetota bacterium]